MTFLFWRCFTGAYLIQAMLAVGFLYPVVLEKMGYSMGAIGVAMSLLNVSAIASRPIGGWATEKKGFGGCLLLSGAISVLATACLWLIPGLPGVISFRIGLGAVGGISMVAISTLQGLVIPESQRSRLFAILGVAYVLPQLTVIPAGEWLLNRDMASLYLLLPVGLTLAAAVAGRGLPQPSAVRTDGNGSDWGSWTDCLRTPGIWAMVMTLASFSIMNSTTLQYLALPVREKGLSASLFFTVNAGTCVFLRVVGNSIAERIPRPVMGPLCITVMATALTGALRAESSCSLVLCAVGYGLGMGFGFPTMLALIPDVFPPRLMPKGSSIGMLAMDLGFALSPLAIGGLSSLLDMSGAMTAMAGAQFFLAPLSMLLWRLAKKQKTALL